MQLLSPGTQWPPGAFDLGVGSATLQGSALLSTRHLVQVGGSTILRRITGRLVVALQELHQSRGHQLALDELRPPFSGPPGPHS